MTTTNHITRYELRKELQEALKPVHERLDRIEGDVKSVQGDVKSITEHMKWLKGHVQDLQTDMVEVKAKMSGSDYQEGAGVQACPEVLFPERGGIVDI